jgi:hypothetical protein
MPDARKKLKDAYERIKKLDAEFGRILNREGYSGRAMRIQERKYKAEEKYYELLRRME